jgi:hypothetical protein
MEAKKQISEQEFNDYHQINAIARKGWMNLTYKKRHRVRQMNVNTRARSV